MTAKNFTINHNHNHNHKGGGGRGRSDTAVVKVSEQGPLGRGGDGDCHRVVGGEWQNDSFPAAAKEEEPSVMARLDGAIADIIRDAIAAQFKEGGGTDRISTTIACTAAAKTVLLSMDALCPVVG